MVSPIFTIDQFKSKMGDDKDVVVVAFKVKEKLPATDLMEFIERGYQAALDADMSTGEERGGEYSVFVELERNDSVPKEILEMLDGVSKLCQCEEWSFRYFRDANLYDATEENLAKCIPLSVEDYANKVLSLKQQKVSEFFDQGAIENITVDQDNNLSISKPYAETLNLKLLGIGEYNSLKDLIPGGLQLDESSRGQSLYLEKYLGNYEIYKIDDKFLIKNGEQAIIVQKDNW
jgi:hypothetical protein